jgi:hypothetical protein
VTICEFGTFIGNIYELQGSIVFLINGDARFGFGLLNMRFLEAKVEVCICNLKKSVDTINTMYLGSLLHVDVKKVAYFNHW